uniref:Uncharacterized protein n=1 Tax=Setaria viridis TaxID=4556 RepID=A0A4V6D331_SETVI|nr:hypothetical protein SEVIR_8G128000v2 [Setaria viridis]
MDQYNHSILVWNTRGLNTRCRRDSLCEVETKLAVIISEMLGTRFTSFAYLPFVGASGGILVACRGPQVACSTVHIGQ